MEADRARPSLPRWRKTQCVVDPNHDGKDDTRPVLTCGFSSEIRSSGSTDELHVPRPGSTQQPSHCDSQALPTAAGVPRSSSSCDSYRHASAETNARRNRQPSFFLAPGSTRCDPGRMEYPRSRKRIIARLVPTIGNVLQQPRHIVAQATRQPFDSSRQGGDRLAERLRTLTQRIHSIECR